MKATPATSAHERYAAQLELLAATEDGTAAAIDAAGEERGWWASGRSWRRTYGRFDPHAAPYCTLLYETQARPQALCVIEVFEREPVEEVSHQSLFFDPCAGWLRLSRFPSDPYLEALPKVMADAVNARVLRYRPKKRCTLRVDDPGTGRTIFAKVLSDRRGDIIAADSVALWNAAARGELGFNVAEPAGWDAATRTVWHGAVPGLPLAPELFRYGADDLAHNMGRACASLTQASITPATVFGAEQQLERTARYAQELCRRVPTLSADAERLLGDLRRAHEKMSSRPHRPIHGAPHAHQWLRDGERLGLVDFDRFCAGDPELDVATFIAEMDFESRARVPVDALNHAFVAGYEAVAGPLDRSKLLAYRAHKRLAKALKAARAVRPDGAVRAARKVRRAQTCLDEGR